MSGLLLLAGFLVAFARPSLTRSIVHLLLAVISLMWVGWWTLYAATAYTGPRPAGETGSQLWGSVVLPGLMVCALGLVVGSLGVVLAGRSSRPLVLVGVALILAGSILQTGIAVATLVSAGLLAAAGAGVAPAGFAPGRDGRGPDGVPRSV